MSEHAARPSILQIVIAWNPETGTITLEGDTKSTVIALGMLECAKNLVLGSNKKSPLEI